MQARNKIHIKSERINNPLVTAIITVYNNPLNELDLCIQSVVNQSYSNVEILLVDDGSSNQYKSKLLNLLQAYPQVKYLSKANGGISSARNFGIKISNAEYICFVDPDDTYHKDKISIQTNILLKNINVSVVAGGSVTYHFMNGITNNQIRMPILVNGNCFPLILNSFLEIHGTPNYLFRKSAIINVGLYDEHLILNEDRDLLFRLSKGHNFITHREVVCTVHKSVNSSTYNLDESKLKSKLKFLERVLCDRELIDFTIKAKYLYKLLILDIILSSKYLEFKENSSANYLRLSPLLKKQFTFKAIIMNVLFSPFGRIIYGLYRLKNSETINLLNKRRIS